MTCITLTRGATVAAAGLLAGCLLLAACGGASDAGAHGVAAGAGLGPAGTAAQPAQGPAGPVRQAARPAAKVLPGSPSVVYTASVTLRSANVLAAARRAVAIVTTAGGYTSGEHALTRRSGGTVRLQLKVPEPVYATVLAQLSGPALGTQVALSQQATDVTQEVADVGRLVTSQHDAITALDGLLRRAGTISALLAVQQQISSDQSALESLEAQQRALDRETSYATITMTLLSEHHRVAARHHAARRGFVAGLTAGWRALRDAAAAALTGLGAALPFLLLAVILAAIGYTAWRRLARRKTGPTAAG
jgi:Domain of unknown function (DUF4349)